MKRNCVLGEKSMEVGCKYNEVGALYQGAGTGRTANRKRPRWPKYKNISPWFSGFGVCACFCKPIVSNFFQNNVLGWGLVLRTIRRRRQWPWRHILGLAPDPISPQLTRILWELVAPEKWMMMLQDFNSTASALIIRTVWGIWSISSWPFRWFCMTLIFLNFQTLMQTN